MPYMWDQDVQDRQSLKIQVSEVRKGWVLVMIPGLFIMTTHFKQMLPKLHKMQLCHIKALRYVTELTDVSTLSFF